MQPKLLKMILLASPILLFHNWFLFIHWPALATPILSLAGQTIQGQNVGSIKLTPDYPKLRRDGIITAIERFYLNYTGQQ